MNFRFSTLSSAVICILMQISHAEDNVIDQNNNSQITKLSTIVVKADHDKNIVGKTIYTKKDLESLPNSQKTITDFLKVNPNVQFSNSAMAGGKQGEISASDVSINGALAYDNKILLDNISLNNLINPADGTNDYAITGLSGSSNATTINTDLLCELQVLDSNVSAEYGEFTGGVIKAKTCAPKTEIGKIHGQLNYDFTSSAWTRFSTVTQEELDQYEKDGATYQNDFVKQGGSLSLYGRLSERLAMSLGVSQRQSDMTIKSKLTTQKHANQKRDNENLNLNIYADLSARNKLRVGLQFQNDQKDLEQINNLNSRKQVNSENRALDLELTTNFQYLKLTQSVVAQKQKMKNESEVHEFISWNVSDAKNWSNTATASEGGYGTQKQNLETFEYKVKAELEPIKFAHVEHQFKLGAGYGHYTADWQRLDPTYAYVKPSGNGIKGIQTCINNNNELDPYCDLTYGNGSGQYHIMRQAYDKGSIDVTQNRAHFFVEDHLNWQNRILMNLGVRADYDNLNKHTNWAPRTSLTLQPFKDQRLSFTAGWNRYYANNVFAYKLQDGINELTSIEARASINDDWKFSRNLLTTNTQKSDLKTPFTDESVFAISGQLGIFDAQLKYVNRDAQDQIRKQRISFSPIVDEYDNFGESKAKIYTLSLSNHQPLHFATIKHRWNLGIDYTDITRNFNNYDDSYNPLTYQQYIKYDGKIIDEVNRPASNFARPWSARLSWDMEFNRFPLKLTHLLRYRSEYDSMIASTIPQNERPVYEGQSVKTEYKPDRVSSSFSWDMRASYDLNLSPHNKLILGLTINNLTNRQNFYTVSTNDVRYTEPGRQFIADLTYKF